MLRAGRHRYGEIAVKVFVLILALWAASVAYCLAHEAAHAAAAVAAGGEVYGIHVSALGDSGRTVYSPLESDMTMAAIYAAGLAATTLLALATLWLDVMPVTALLAIRTMLSTLNFAPGTDMARIYALAGEISIYLTIALLAINLAVIALCVKRPLTDLIEASSSLWRARPANNSPE